MIRVVAKQKACPEQLQNFACTKAAESNKGSYGVFFIGFTPSKPSDSAVVFPLMVA